MLPGTEDWMEIMIHWITLLMPIIQEFSDPQHTSGEQNLSDVLRIKIKNQYIHV
jgi:hypothetical protein